VSSRALSNWIRHVAVARAASALLVAVVVVGCEAPPSPRSIEDFMEDGLAREGVLARCNTDRVATAGDVECTNARRAAVIVAAESEGERLQALELESQRKLVAMRDRSARQAQAEQEAAAAAKAAAEAAYDAQWRNAGGAARGPAANQGAQAPAFGAPLGSKMPSMSESRPVDEFAPQSLSEVPALPELELAAAEPPPNDIAPPQLEIERNAIIPRPFRNGDSDAR
jgi:hypothetical protein